MGIIERTNSNRPFAYANGQTVLGSFLQFTGVACCSFHVIAKESGRPVLVQAEKLSDSWREFFETANIQAPVGLLKKDIHGLLENEAELARAVEEFNAVFRAPELPVPLWESLWLSEEKLLFTEESFAVREWYRRFNWEIHRTGYEPEDHLGFETAFCGWLFDAAVNDQNLEYDPDHPQPTLDDVRGFLAEHFSRWAPECFTRLAGVVKTPFWVHLLTSASLLSEALANDI